MADDSGPQSGSQRGNSDADVTFRRRRNAPRRRDARANLARLVEVARDLAGERGLIEVSVDEIAARAGVGKGTVYRAFGDKAGIAAALLDDDERRLQEAILAGPPPLGRGAAPLERVQAFVRTYTEFLDRNVDLLLAADQGAPAARHHSGAYAFWLAHLRGVLAAGGVREHPTGAGAGTGHRGDAEGAAHAVLALLDPELFFHLRRERGYPLSRVAALIDAAARGIADRALAED